ncbi:MAG: SDR family oxidoreductase [Armatimonadota bacterium]
MSQKIFSLDNSVVAVTGGSGGLFGPTCRYLAQNGATVIILDRMVENAQALASSICNEGGNAIALSCNVLDRSVLEGCRETIMQQYGRLDGLINAAGGNNPKATTPSETASVDDLMADNSFFQLPQEAFGQVFDLNLVGTLLPSQVFSQVMVKQHAGSIVNIASMNAIRPLTKIPAYSAAKSAVLNLTQWMAVHLAPVGVRVNAISPGFFITEQNRFLLTDAVTGEYSPRGQKVIAHTPMARFGESADLWGAIHWLLTDASRFVTGSMVAIDGGFSSYSGV